VPTSSAAEFLPADHSLAALREASKGCRGCELYERGTLLGNQFRVSKQRGQLVSSPLAPNVMATVHPSSILRAPDDETREVEMELFIRDLQKVVRCSRSS